MADPETPAVLIEPTPESRAELLHVVTAALHHSDVTLADDALTQSSLLLIERKPARDPTGRRLSGRDYDKPEQFQLVTDGRRCTLIHQGGARYELEHARCAPAQTPSTADR